MSEADVRRCIESVSMNVGSMRLAEALREASRMAPVEAEDLRVGGLLSDFEPKHSTLVVFQTTDTSLSPYRDLNFWFWHGKRTFLPCFLCLLACAVMMTLGQKEQVKAVVSVATQLKTEKAITESVSALEPDEEDNLMK